MEEHELERLRQAGMVARKVKNSVYSMVKEGMSLLELCEAVEASILSEGCRPAFPCNICIDSIAAHYSPTPDDSTTIPYGSLVKVDMGVELDGYIADAAITISFAKEAQRLVQAAESALSAAIKIAKHGVRVSDIGAAIQDTIQSYGLKPIKNLSGHEISKYNLHAGTSIPNVRVPDFKRLQAGKVYAIEPFVTHPDGAGEVVSAKTFTIFRFTPSKSAYAGLGQDESSLLLYIERSFKGLPYSTRWLKKSDIGDCLSIHERLFKLRKVSGYPVLVEKKGRPVAQAEATIYVTDNGCEVLT